MRTFLTAVAMLLAGIGLPAQSAPPATGAAAAAHGGMPPSMEPADVKVPKAEGPDARTVAEVVGGKAALKGKTVLVRGKVVKYNPGILGKNWVHLRDGSGSAANKTNDILVTSKEETRVGDVVQARGVVRTDVDLGSGYVYAVMIEEATLRK